MQLERSRLNLQSGMTSPQSENRAKLNKNIITVLKYGTISKQMQNLLPNNICRVDRKNICRVDRKKLGHFLKLLHLLNIWCYCDEKGNLKLIQFYFQVLWPSGGKKSIFY